MPTSLDKPKRDQRVRGDQASELRALIARKPSALDANLSAVRRCQTIVVWGGKGGVGRSVIATNLSIAFAQRGESVGLLDASPDLGNVELLCGLNGYWNLSHVAQGCRRVDDVIQNGPAGIQILSGASCLTNDRCMSVEAKNRFVDQLQSFERDLDWLIVDGSGGASDLTRNLALLADDVLFVTNNEPTGVAEAYSSIKSLAKHAGPRLGLLVNQSDSPQQSQQILDRLQQTVHSFLRLDLHRRGHVPHDVAVPNSVQSRIPFLIQSPQSPASAALTHLVDRWTRRNRTDDGMGFFSRLMQSEQ